MRMAKSNFKSKAKAFVRTYGFLASILPYTNADWKQLSILDTEVARSQGGGSLQGILETIDMDSYRVEVQAQMSISLLDEDGEVGPIPTSAGGKPEH